MIFSLIIFPQGSFQLYYHISTVSRGEEVDSVQQTLTQPIQDRTSTLTGSSQVVDVRTQLFLNGGLRVVCREGYFGSDCSCRDNSTGHFTCDANGTKVCLPGYQNPETNCTEEALITPEPTTETVPTANPASQTTETSQPTPQTIQQNITTFITEALTTIGITNAGTTMDVLPIAVGGAVGGLVVVVIIILITILLVLKTKRKKKSEEDGELKELHMQVHTKTNKHYIYFKCFSFDELKHTQYTCTQTNSVFFTHTRPIATTIMNLEELPNSKNNTDGIDALNLYASVNKDASE